MEDRHSSQVAQNPFAALFPSVEKAEEYRKQHNESDLKRDLPVTTHTQSITVSLKEARENDPKSESEHTEVEKINDEKDRVWMVNDMLQRVFLITVDEGNLSLINLSLITNLIHTQLRQNIKSMTD